MSLAEILDSIATCQQRFKKPAQNVTLIAVSKTQPTEKILPLLQEGHRVFGENKVQEAVEKWPAFQQDFQDIELHLLGPLQTNKARQAIEIFDVIHSLDRPKLAQTLHRLKKETGHCPKLFIQINTGEEPQKAGILPQKADAFITECLALDLPVIGLMCLPPHDEEPSLHFALLAKIAHRHGLHELSMGMSADFQTAIAQGATYVRIGTALFGERS